MRTSALQTGDRVAWDPSGCGVVAAAGLSDPRGRVTVAVWECGGAPRHLTRIPPAQLRAVAELPLAVGGGRTAGDRCR